MSAGLCIPDLIANGVIPRGKGAEALRRYEELLNVYDQQMGGAAAEALATDQVVKALEAEVQRKKANAALQIDAQSRIMDQIQGYRGKKGRADGAPIDPKAAQAIIDRDEHAKYSNVEGRKKAVRHQALGQLSNVLASLRRNIVGEVRDKVLERDIVRAIFGDGNVSTSAREMADAASGAMDYLRLRYNAGGGDIGKIEHYFPQRHDWERVRATSFEEWSADQVRTLDRDKIIDRDTGTAMSDDKLQSMLGDIYESIRTDGASDMIAGRSGYAPLASRRREERVLHYKSADDWLEMNAKYGAAGPFETLMGYVDGMSRDIAAMEILGPNPDASVRWLSDVIRQDARVNKTAGHKEIDGADAAAKRTGDLWDEYMGRNSVAESRRLAAGFGALRAVQTSSKLGTAIFSAIGDAATQAVTRKFNGLPVMKTITDYLGLLTPGSGEDLAHIISMGGTADYWADASAAINRLTGEEWGNEVTRRLAEGTLRASGLSRFTMVGRAVYFRENVRMMAREVGKGWDHLDPAFRGMFERYGLGADDWSAIRATPLTPYKGVPELNPRAVADARLSDRLLEMIHSEMDFAVPAVDLHTRTLMNSIGTRGTWAGEIARSGFLFKSFGLTVLATHGRRALAQNSLSGMAEYAALLTVMATMAGAMSLQARQLQKGKDPLPMTTPAFWGKASLQGGGWGIFGDFVGASENRFGGGLTETLAGPMAQTASNVADLTVGNALKLARGDDTDFWHDTLRIMRQEVPVASSLWYVRPAYDRLVLNWLDRLADPDHDAKMRLLEARAERDGAGYFIAPDPFDGGSRAPNFSNALGGTEQ